VTKIVTIYCQKHYYY